MIRIILSILFLINITYAQKLYYIKFGSFRNLAGLERNINRMPYEMRSHVIIIESNGWFIPFAYHTAKFYALKSKLPLYKRYFPDAHIASSPNILNHRVIRNYIVKLRRGKQPKKEKYISPPQPIRTASNYQYQNRIKFSNIPNINSLPFAKTIPVNDEVKREIKIIPTPTKSINSTKRRYDSFDKKMLSGRHYYLTYKSTKKGTPNLLIKVNFKNHRVTYQPIIGEMNMREAKYLVDGKKLYMFADTFSKDGAFSKIEANRRDYILVSSWFNGKKINTLRYYYDLNRAKNYLGKRGSSKLATALEDGEFDRVEQAFIGVDGVYAIDDDEDW